MHAECEKDCFSIEGTNKKELAEMLRIYVKNQHGMKITEAEAEKKVMTC